MNHETILVTGGAGYIGSHAVHSLISSGRNVVVVDRDKEACDALLDRYAKKKKKGTFKVHCTDITNDVWMDGILENERPTAVMHFAADLSVPESVQNPLKYFNNNTSKTINLIDRLVRHGIYRFINSSTCAVYGTPSNPNNITESTICKPVNPYGHSKLMNEFVLKQVSTSIPAFKYTSFRYFNVAGCHLNGKILDYRWKDKGNVIPKFINNVLKGDELHVYGTDYETLDGSCIRDYIHPEDLISAHMIALDNDIEGVYNLGSGIGYSVWQIVENLVAVTGKNLDVAHKPRRAGDPSILIANHEKFTKATGWEPTFTLKEIIATAWKAYGV